MQKHSLCIPSGKRFNKFCTMLSCSENVADLYVPIKRFLRYMVNCTKAECRTVSVLCSHLCKRNIDEQVELLCESMQKTLLIVNASRERAWVSWVEGIYLSVYFFTLVKSVTVLIGECCSLRKKRKSGHLDWEPDRKHSS